MSCNCIGIHNGSDPFECFNCGRLMLVDAREYPVFDLGAQKIVDVRQDTIAADWLPLLVIRKHGKRKIVPHVPGHDRAAQLSHLLEAA